MVNQLIIVTVTLVVACVAATDPVKVEKEENSVGVNVGIEDINTNILGNPLSHPHYALPYLPNYPYQYGIGYNPWNYGGYLGGYGNPWNYGGYFGGYGNHYYDGYGFPGHLRRSNPLEDAATVRV